MRCAPAWIAALLVLAATAIAAGAQAQSFSRNMPYDYDGFDRMPKVELAVPGGAPRVVV